MYELYLFQVYIHGDIFNMTENRKLVSVIALIAVFTLFLFSCSADSDTSSQSTESETETAATDESINLTSDGNAEYVVVRGDSAEDTEIDAAVSLYKALNGMEYGSFTITSDWLDADAEDSAASIKEILVGKTSRDESINALSTLEENSYIVEVIGNKIVILGYSSLGTAKAVEDIISDKIDIFDNTDTSSELSVSKDYKYIGTYDNVLAHTIINYASSVGADIGGSEQDSVRLTTCLQGLINRDFDETDMLVHQTMDSKDTFWINYMTEDGNYFADYEIYDISTADEYLNFFLPYIKKYGIVAWDASVPSTANVASTICGVDSYLPVMYSEDSDSLYQSC